ncbi:hypothetical protein CHS0354_039633 [Potamilus streckersoni]|uniref:Uncharacterized protein n=1 Tax=Potamilus streckersoni TaxID=2493646 RepID=A0AAE0SJI1_9BIVA|nr:hypothetical protein CHS0354_039633 [Potamilus streckersoni]
MSSSRMVHDLILVISLLSITCFVPSRNTDPTIHVEENPATWKTALEGCVGRGERLVSPQNLPDKDKDRLLSKLEKDVKFWTMPINISQVVVWSGCVQEKSKKALSQHDIPMSYFGMKSSLPKCLGYCLNRDTFVAVGLKIMRIKWPLLKIQRL